jgi:spore germination protein KC
MKKLIFFIIPLTICLCSCNGREEVNKLSFLTTFGIESSDDSGYKLIIQYLKPKQEEEPVPITKSVSGPTILEAFNKLNKVLAQKPYLSHSSVILLSEEVARKKGIAQSLDFFRRNIDIRQDSVVLVTESPEKVMNKLDEEKSSGEKLKLITQNSSELSSFGEVTTLFKVYQNLYFKVPYLTITHMKLEGNETEIDGISIFKKDKYVETIRGDEAKGWGLFSLKKSDFIITTDCLERKNGQITYQINKVNKKKNNVFINRNNILQIEASFEFESTINENQCSNLDLNNRKNIQILEKMLNEKIKTLISDSIKYATNELVVDYYGFGNLLYLSNPDSWEKIEESYDELFENAAINVEVNVKLLHTGAAFN